VIYRALLNLACAVLIFSLLRRKFMRQRPLGSSGISVSEIGLGCWQLASEAWGLSSSDDALRIVRASLDGGCDFFDTAPGYSNGKSELLLGQAMQSVRDRVTICSKFGHTAEGKTTFDIAELAPSVEGSLRRLRTDRIDVLLLHNPPREMMNGSDSPLFAALEKLKASGKIRVYGVSLDWREELQTIADTTRSGAAEVLLNVFHQEPLAAFKRAAERGIGLIVKVPLDSGWLSGKYRTNSKFDDVRKRWPAEVIARRANLVEQFAALLPPGTSIAHGAMQYILAQPEVSTIIPGAKSVEQALENFAAADGQLSPSTVKEICALWERELENDPLPW
jgi:aryl-alcohol dehydrogenase-like predicted oxidoreductase